MKLPMRQGDIIVIPVHTKPAPDTIEPAPKDPRGIVLAEGETSGHFHGLIGRGKLFRFRDAGREEMLLRVTGKGGGKLAVIGGEVAGSPRHEPLTLPAGDYIVRAQRTWTSAARAQKAAD